MNDTASWLDLVDEDIIDPQRPLVDPHHHLWHHDKNPYLLDELHGDTGRGHNVVATVFIECGSQYYTDGPEALKPVGETAFAAKIARRSAATNEATIAGIVGHGDLLLGEAIEEVLAAHIEAGGGEGGSGLFRGIRHSAAYDPSPDIRVSHSAPPPDLYERPEARAALKVLGAMGLTFDAWHYHPYIKRFCALARALPETQFILDHFGGPLGIGPYAGKQDEIFDVWRDDIAALAACDNVVMKIGGLAMPVNGWGWHARERPATSDELVATHGRYYTHVMECFGADRAMFESNFPVDKRSISYPVLWNGFKKIAAPWSETEKDAVFSQTAKKIYRLAV